MSQNLDLTLSWEAVFKRLSAWPYYKKRIVVYGIPRGGAIIAGFLGMAFGKKIELSTDPSDCDVVVDDVLDSGKTLDAHFATYGVRPSFVLVDKKKENIRSWVNLPWEHSKKIEGEDLIVRLIEMIGEDAAREGLQETPRRVIESFKEIYKGYHQNPESLIKTFDHKAIDEMIVLKNCELYSTCEHHLQPFFGKIHIGYVPNQKVIGISKLARIAECFSRRLQIQERIGEQIVDFLMEHLNCHGAACIIEAKHFCMCARGVNKQNSKMVTSNLAGVFRKYEVRQEFINLIQL